MTQFDDPNREAVGLDPIWTEGPIPDAEPEAQQAEPKPELKAKAKAEPRGKDDEAG
jgi:hypothetical protein